MKPGELGAGYIRVLAQRNRDPALIQAAKDLLNGMSPADSPTSADVRAERESLPHFAS